MAEEISLRELIEVVVKGKKIVIGITIIAIFIAAILSYFVIKPTYETSATILVNNKQQDGESPLDSYLNEVVSPKVYKERLQSQQILSRVIENHNFDSWSAQGIKGSLTIENEKDSNILTVKLKGGNPKLIQETLVAIINETNKYSEEAITAHLSKVTDQYKEQMRVEKENLNKVLEEYNIARADEGLPAIVLLDAITTKEKQYIINVDQKYIEELKTLNKTKQVEFLKLNNQVNTLTELYNNYSENYEEARSVSNLNNIDNKVTIVTEPSVPTLPIAPRKALNMAIAMVLGLMVSVGIVFFMHYWRETGKSS